MSSLGHDCITRIMDPSLGSPLTPTLKPPGRQIVVRGKVLPGRTFAALIEWLSEASGLSCGSDFLTLTGTLNYWTDIVDV